MKLIVVDCSRVEDECDGEPSRCVVFASDAAEAERLCRGELSGEGFTQFTVQDPERGAVSGAGASDLLRWGEIVGGRNARWRGAVLRKVNRSAKGARRLNTLRDS